MDGNWALARRRPTLIHRARIVQTIRAFFVAQQFLEIETPHLLPGNAPERYIDPVAAGKGFLQTSPELCMKRLLAAGYPLLFQLCRCWREGERGRRHLPEYTMLEWYRLDADYQALMEDCEALISELCSSDTLCYQNTTIDLRRPWPRLTVAEAFTRYASLPLATALAEERFDEIMALEVEPQFDPTRPLFLVDYPVEHAALARPKSSDPSVAERFELYLGGLELANAFSELTDPIEQRQRFIADESARHSDGKAPTPLPEKFLSELATLKRAAGIALGVDRLVMLLTDSATIDEVVAFSPDDL
ncbi:MAG: EF-P lysine aminoacylase GenX [Desulfuromonas sp.]|nr:MAG: EF-P lysine aminoacylase GenX [Desulfuromonas sp.]